MSTQQEEIDAMLFKLTLECARPSWRFRALFSAQERQLIGFAINTFMGQRQHNLLMAQLDQRYGKYQTNPGQATQAEAVSAMPVPQ
jgi:hypothetical protein